jgi:septal ring factor EnvC (AmiA/AmiB activator)
MTDETFHNRPDDTLPEDSYVNPDKQRLELLTYEVQRLRSRLGWVSGLSFAVLILTSILAGLTLSVKLRQDQQTQQVGVLAGDKAGDESQIDTLNQQVAALNQQVASLSQQMPKDLANQQKATQAQIKQLQAQIQKLDSEAVSGQQLDEALQKVQPSLNNGGLTTPPSPAPGSQ